jgi:hypothetical protein
MKIYFSIFFCFIVTLLNGQFYNNNVNFKYIGIDTSSEDFRLICNNDDGTLTYGELHEDLNYKGQSKIRFIDNEIDLDKIIEIEKPKNIDVTFEELYKEIKRNIYLFNNYTIQHHQDYRFVLSYFDHRLFSIKPLDSIIINNSANENSKINEDHSSYLISFNKVLLDGETPLLVAFPNLDGYDAIIAFFDKNHKFHFFDQDLIKGEVLGKRYLKHDENKIQKTVLEWFEKHDTTSYIFFNGQSHDFFKNDYGVPNLKVNFNDDYEQSYTTNTTDKIEHGNNFKISEIKKYPAGELLKAVKGKVFMQSDRRWGGNDKPNTIKFINESGGTLFVYNDVEFSDSYMSYFREIKLIEDITILYNGRYTLVPFQDHFRLFPEVGDFCKNIDLDIIFGKEIRKRIVNSKDNILFEKKDGKWGIKDNVNKTILIPAVYDTLFIANDNWRFGLFLAKKKKKVIVFNAMFEKIFESNKVQDCVLNNHSAQILEDGQMFYLTADGSKSKSVPIFGFISECGWDGMVMMERKKIKQIKTNEYEIHSSDENNSIEFEFFMEEPIDSSFFTKKRSVKIIGDSINFINSKKDYSFETSDIWKNHIVNYKGNKIDLLKLDFSNENIINQTIELTVDEILFIDSNHPLMYRVGNLWGYYKLNSKPKYKSISPFNGHLARIESTKGKMGWINREGNEFWD